MVTSFDITYLVASHAPLDVPADALQNKAQMRARLAAADIMQAAKIAPNTV
jgi:hypothetical protein